MKNIALVLFVLLLGGCMEPEIEKTAPEDAQSLVDSFVYKKANNGLCFGVTTTSRLSSNFTVAEANLVVLVDCSRVGL